MIHSNRITVIVAKRPHLTFVPKAVSGLHPELYELSLFSLAIQNSIPSILRSTD
jgi:hypothetical protein